MLPPPPPPGPRGPFPPYAAAAFARPWAAALAVCGGRGTPPPHPPPWRQFTYTAPHGAYHYTAGPADYAQRLTRGSPPQTAQKNTSRAAAARCACGTRGPLALPLAGFRFFAFLFFGGAFLVLVLLFPFPPLGLRLGALGPRFLPSPPCRVFRFSFAAGRLPRFASLSGRAPLSWLLPSLFPAGRPLFPLWLSSLAGLPPLLLCRLFRWGRPRAFSRRPLRSRSGRAAALVRLSGLALFWGLPLFF